MIKTINSIRSTKSAPMQTIADILTKFNPMEDKYISREFQSYGYYLATELDDLQHRSIYMKLAKTLPRAVLEKALSFTKDAKVKRRGALFMWKLKELGAWGKKKETGEKKTAVQEDIPF
jgi:hypothetical protein